MFVADVEVFCVSAEWDLNDVSEAMQMFSLLYVNL